MQRIILNISLLIGCSALACVGEPDTTTQYSRLFDAQPTFADGVDAYTTELRAAALGCGLEDLPTHEVSVEFIDTRSIGATFSRPDTIWVSIHVLPFANYGHEYVRWLLYWTGSDLWNDSSDDWSEPLLNCLWNAAETLSLRYDNLS